MTEQGNHVAIGQKALLLQTMTTEKAGEIQKGWKELNRPNDHNPFPCTVFDREMLKPVEIATNRYPNIPCNDHHRVKLPIGKYIHANYIRGADGKKKLMIATQGPLKATVSDFWSMAVHEKCPAIVMLCRCKEAKLATADETEKCYGYWPTSMGTTFRTKKFLIQAESIEEIVFILGQKQEKIIKTAIKVVDVTTKEVIHRLAHFQYLDWQDLSVPDSTRPLMHLLKRHILPAMKLGGPIIVHCSAGVGRTGVFVGAVLCLNLFLHGQLISIPRALALLRRQRGKSVQSFQQYIFMHMLFVELVEYCSAQQLSLLKEKYGHILERIKKAQNGRKN